MTTVCQHCCDEGNNYKRSLALGFKPVVGVSTIAVEPVVGVITVPHDLHGVLLIEE